MSVKVMTWAFEQQIPPGEKMVLLALADRAREEDGLCWPGQKELAAKASVSPKTVSRTLARLEERGLIERTERRRADGGRMSDLVRLCVDGGAANLSGGALDTAVQGPRTPARAGTEPSEEPSRDLASTARPKPISYQGKRVEAAIVQIAESLLGTFNEATGRKLSARAQNGGPTPYLRQIIGALLLRPEVTPPEWERAIRNSAANPPGWVKDRQLQTGDIFGERAADHALSNNGQSGNGRRDRGVTVSSLQALKGTLG